MKKVLITLSFLMVLGIQMMLAQSRTISGTVTDATDGSQIPGVTVFVKGSSTGTVTGGNGKYSFSVPQNAQSLVFTFIGMKSQEVVIGNRTTINVVLENDEALLDEIIVVAYGTATKKSYTGSQVSIKGESLQKIQTSNVTRALEGKVAGVQTASSSGQPGSGASIRIRGMGSLSASSSPLFIVDGMPFEGDVNSISQVDIESMTVLKDASATSLYGSRAANGVIMITTKRGTGRKPKITFDSKFGTNSRAYSNYDIMTDPSMYYETYWEVLRNNRYYNNGDSYLQAGQYASDHMIKWTNPTSGAIESRLGYNNYDVADNVLINPLTGKLNENANLLYHDDWAKETFKNGARQEHSFSLSGVNEGTNYFMSFNYLSDEGYSPNTSFERYTSRLKINQEVNKWLKMGVNMSYVHTNTQDPTSTEMSSANVFYITSIMAPIYPVYKRDLQGNLVLKGGKKQYDFGDNADMHRPVALYANPSGTQLLDTEKIGIDRLNINSNAVISFTEELKLSLNLGVDKSTSNRLSVNNNQIGQFSAVGGTIYKTNSTTKTVNSNQILSYDKKFGGDHSISAKIGHEYYDWEYSHMYGGKSNYLFPSISEMDWAVVMSSVGSYGYDYSLESYFGNVNYGFKERYYLDASFRRDGSSRFHPDNRWGSFWSIGGSWIINKENFLSDVDLINNLKFRASYGSVGNDNLGSGAYYYAYMDQYDVVNNNGSVGLQFAFKGNKDLKWESNKSLTIGLDYGLFDRISGNIDYFNRTSSDLLFNLPQAPSTGISSIPYNIGELMNNGFELELSAKLVKSNDFNVTLDINATTYNTTITKLPDMYKKDGITRGAYQKWQEGSSPYIFYMREFAGVDQSSGQGMWYKDVKDVDGNITGRETTTEWSQGTRYVLDKTSTPDLFGGISLMIDYKGFDLSLQTAYQIGGYVYDGVYASFMHGGSEDSKGSNWHKDILKRWTPNNTNTTVPRLEGYVDSNNTDDRWLVKGDYFSLKNIVLGYTLPQSITKKLDIQSLRFYAVGDNLFFSSRRQGFDPRMYFSGVLTSDDMNYAPIKTVSVGVNLTF